VLDSIGQKVVDEGDTLEFTVSAIDPDGTTPQLLVQSAPRRSSFVDNGDGTGVFTFAPDFQQSGLASPKFVATDGSLTDHEIVMIQIVDIPQPPILTAPTEPLEVLEGDTLEIVVSATDADSTIPMIDVDTSLISLISSFVDSGNGTAVLEFMPLYIHSGIWDIVFTAMDEDSLADTAVVTVNVLDAGNQPPVILTPIEGVTIQRRELDDLVFNVTTTDADSVPPILSASGLPTGATFEDNGDFTGSLVWMDIPNLTAGTYPITFYANDGEDPGIADSVHITLEILDYNYPPSPIFFIPFSVCLGDDCSMDLNEGDTASFQFASGDQDGASPLMVGWRYQIVPDTVFDTIVFVPPVEVDTILVADTSYLPLPENMEVNDLGNDTADFLFTPDFTQAGTYRVFLMALDAVDTTIYRVVRFTFYVDDVPMGPILEPIGAQTLTEGDTLDLTIRGYDPDGGNVTIYAQNLPPGANFTVVEPNTAVNRFFYNPGYTDAGVYNVLFFVRENAFPNEADSETVAITVEEAGPQAPVIVDLPDSHEVNVDDTLAIWLRSTDADSGPPGWSMEAIPSVPGNAVFADSANGNGSFTFVPDSTQVDSTWELTFIASDGTLADSVTTVVGVRQYIPGDADANGSVNVSDIVYLIDFVFATGPAPQPLLAGDCDGSGTVNVSDIAYLIQFIFGEGPPPVGS
jgi:hypothetical protein